MLKHTETPTMESHRLTEYDYQRKYQDEAKRAEFRNVRREAKQRGVTYEQLSLMTTNENPSHHAIIASEAVGRSSDILAAGWVPDLFFAQILEGAQYQQVGRQIANVYNAPEGQPHLIYREFDRFLRPQIVGEDDEFRSQKGTMKTQSLDFVTVGDRVNFTWQSLKDFSIDQTGLELRAVGAGIALEEDRFVMNAMYEATSGDNKETYSNSTTYASTNGYLPFAEIMRYKARMAAPSATSHPNLDEQTRDTLLNLYNANILIVSPAIYEDLTTNYLTMDNAFWRNSKILDDGSITTAFGMTIYRMNVGHFISTNYEWLATNDVYWIDTRMGGVDFVQKEPLQLVDWPTNEYRRQNMMVYERFNSIVRNRRSIFRLEVVQSS